MRIWYYKLLCIVSALACQAAMAAASSSCCLVLYEPEMPEELRGM